jgi:hypothetical protein
MFHIENKNLPTASFLGLVSKYIHFSLILPLWSVCFGVKEINRKVRRYSVNERGVPGRILALVAFETFSDVLESSLCHRVVVRAVFVGEDQEITVIVDVSARVDTRNTIAKASIKPLFDLILRETVAYLNSVW